LPLRAFCYRGCEFQEPAVKGVVDMGLSLSKGGNLSLSKEAPGFTKLLLSTNGLAVAALLAQTAPYGNVASCGLAASPELHATVMPFIIRGVSLLGVASAGTARDIRDEVWRRLAGDWKPHNLDAICTREATLDELPQVFDGMLAGGALGRTVVRIPPVI